jgi:aryl-alcohol dehydrogenase-like predicted oxidoreductase
MTNETITLAGRPVRRMGFGAMQLPGPGVFGPPKDREAALSVLRRAVESGVNHIDTAQFYGPNVANELIHTALFPYPEDLVLVSKVGAARNDEGHWVEAQHPEQLRAGILENLASLEIEQVPVVNLRRHPDGEVPFAEQLDAMISFRDEGLIGAIGLSNVNIDDYTAGTAKTEIACVQNAYNLIDRSDQAVFDACQAKGVPYAPFFPMGSAFNPSNPVLNSDAVKEAAERLSATPAQIALAWLLQLSPNVLLIPGTSSLHHLEQNLAAADLELDAAAIEAIG